MNNKEIEILVSGMVAPLCASRVQESIEHLPGVVEARVNYLTGRVTVAFNKYLKTTDNILNAIHTCGFYAEILPRKQEFIARLEPRRCFFDWLTAVLISLPLWLSGFQQWLGHAAIGASIQLVLATLVQFWCGWRFYCSAYYSVKAGKVNKDILITIASSAMYVFGLFIFALDLEEPYYFETSAAIIAIALLGRWLESLISNKAAEILINLANLQPRLVCVQRDGAAVIIPLDELQRGDSFIVKPGELIPADGVIVEGQSSVNEALITGETFPIPKKEGFKVYAGTVNLNNALTVRTEAVGLETILAEKIRLVHRAYSSRISLQQNADKIALLLVPLTILLSLITFGIWFWVSGWHAAVVNAATVLLISSPAALSLAIPAIQVAVIGLGFSKGILFKQAEAIQKISNMSLLIFDKTGSLSEGKPRLVEILPMGNTSDKQLLAIAAALEHNISHFFSDAILEQAKSLGITPEPVQSQDYFIGKGIIAEKRGERFGIGSPRFAEERGIAINKQKIESLEEKGYSICVIWRETEVLGYLALLDRLRADGAKTIQMLKYMGIESVIISSDEEKTVESMANELRVSRYFAEILPENKADYVQQLRSDKKVVGMMGGGVNSAPALAAADVSLAIGSGGEVFEIADVALMQNELYVLTDVVRIAKAGIQKMRKNLVFAVLYNTLGLILAISGMLNPIFAITMAFLGTLGILTNALLLNPSTGKA